ncbi:MAG: hypothetical protein ACRD01_10125 [Terriglobales bacterium]
MNPTFPPDPSPEPPESELELCLRDLFRREDPPAALAQRLLARAAHRPAPVFRPWRRTPAARLAAVLLALCACLVVGLVHRRQVENQQAQQAQARLRMALQITTSELDWAENSITRDLAPPRGAPPVHGRKEPKRP